MTETLPLPRSPAFARSLARAMIEWRAALGADNVVDQGDAWRIANSPCCGRAGDVLAILYPAGESDVVACLAIGRAHRVPLHVVSRGCNWGYGSLQPPNGKAAILCLKRLNALRPSRTEPGRVRVQPGVTEAPGVTFADLAAWIRREAPEWLPPATGAGPDVSVLGNALAGGIGKGPYGWMARRLFEPTLVSADGRLERPGRSDQEGPREPAAVLEADFQLCRAPAYHALAWARLEDGAAAFTAAYRLACGRVPALGTPGGVEMLNGARLRVQSPGWYGSPGRGAAAGSPAPCHADWTIGVTAQGGDEAEAASGLACIRDRLAGLPVREIGEIRPEGTATTAPLGRAGLASAYTATGRDPPPEADPDRDGCGVRWIAVLLPAEPDAAAETLAAFGAMAERHGFPPALAVRFPDGDPVGLLGLFWSRQGPGAEVAAADARAVACAASCRSLAARLGVRLHRDRRG